MSITGFGSKRQLEAYFDDEPRPKRKCPSPSERSSSSSPHTPLAERVTQGGFPSVEFFVGTSKPLPIPLPNFVDMSSGISSQKCPPATPGYSQKRFKPNVFSNAAVLIAKGQISNFKTSYFTYGSFFNVYKVETNEQILVKAYVQKLLVKRLPIYAQNSLDQYQRIKDSLNVTRILNNSLVEGYFVVEKARSQINYSLWDNECAIEEQSPEAKRLLDQLKVFFEYALKNNEPLDLKPENLMMDRDGKVILVDFMEEITPGLDGDLVDDDGDDVKWEYLTGIKKAAIKFAQGNDHILTFLLEGWEIHDLDAL